ncbi:MAG TPA: hypothetical protein VF467_15280, partial [Afipia sp.]
EVSPIPHMRLLFLGPPSGRLILHWSGLSQKTILPQSQADRVCNGKAIILNSTSMKHLHAQEYSALKNAIQASPDHQGENTNGKSRNRRLRCNGLGLCGAGLTMPRP